MMGSSFDFFKTKIQIKKGKIQIKSIFFVFYFKIQIKRDFICIFTFEKIKGVTSL